MPVSVPDAVTIEVIRQSFNSIAREMHQVLVRSAYGAVIYEMNDCSVGVFDVEGSLLGQSPGLPLFIGGLDYAIHAVQERFTDVEPGDAFAVNDSVIVGSHLNDVSVVAPIFDGGVHLGWGAAKGHWQDVGAKDAGETANSTEIYQEGIRFQPIRVMRQDGWVRDVVDLLAWNSRTPDILVGDLNAQVAACRLGERRFVEVAHRYGYETLMRARDEIFRHSEAAEIRFIESLPDGTYHAVGFFDNDGHSNEPVPVELTIRVDASELTFDLSGSSPQRTGSTNCGLSQTVSAARLALQYLMHAEDPPSGGSFRHMHVVAPEGSIFNAQTPAACMMYGCPLGMMLNLVWKALAEAAPASVIAGQPDSSCNVIFTGRDDIGSLFISGEATAIGWGARAGSDGQSASIDAMGGDLKNHPVETMEAKRPLFVHRYTLRTDSGGPGTWRGGLGVDKVYEVLGEETDLTLWFERAQLPGWGLFGGGDGVAHGVLVEDSDVSVRTLKVNHLGVKRGATVSVLTGGGGGYGSPFDRPIEAVQEDVRMGYVTRQKAQQDYGVCFLDESLSVDVEATAILRGRVADIPAEPTL